MHPFRHLSRLLVSSLLVACASSGAGGGGGEVEGGRDGAVLVRLRDFRTGQRYELASESHTDRVAYYSGERTDAARKVQTDEIMSAFLGELDRQGFGAHARAGRAPSVGATDVIRWGLEVESETSQAHWLVGTRSEAADWQAFQRCRDMFLELYNYTVSYQAVENASGKSFFDEQARPGQKRP